MNLEETMQAIKEADDNTLYILWTNADPVATNLMVFMYAENSMKYQKWDAITIIVWAPRLNLWQRIRRSGKELKSFRIWASTLRRVSLARKSWALQRKSDLLELTL